ncbi:MAG: CO dehydrogenase/CO-methylating acetyl-CoA synthase complex subunit beta [Deltaproteobacteria bacterium]|nr:CO dehydrogenase/CO-methylating acetyl-CoA synthase complex subunit beta [Candidatus Anaeroferrophillus wilburensis]MBN2888862.1 CO dehydrogenase/CO-methylating acetyl-CoA synthase complex subunit beta [Deltaproteobacteria bacterium]
MSKLIISSAIRGAHAVVDRVEGKVNAAIAKFGADHDVKLPNTGYYLPVIYGMTGYKVEKLGDMPEVIKMCRDLLPEIPAENCWLPYLGPGLDAGMATAFAFDVEEALKYLENCPYLPMKEDPEDTDPDIWLGAADDIILRKRGVEFVDGSAPGFAAVVGAAKDVETAVKIAKELQEKSIYVFMAGCNPNTGISFAEQLKEGGVQLGWNTRLVPFGKDTSAAIHALGFATRAALTFGGIKPGDFKGNLLYNKNRVFAFVLALDEVDDEKYAAAAGAINWGFPTIADTDIPEVLPTGVCTYEHVVSNIPQEEIVAKGIEVRGLKITITKIDIPVSYGPAFEGERIKKDAMQIELGGPKSFGFEFAYSKPLDEVEDGKFEVVGPDLKDVEAGGLLPIGIWIELAGRKFQEDFEPILERQCHHLLNGAEGVLHIGQRDIVWMRISKKAYEAGFTLKHFGTILHAKMHNEFGAIVDKVQVTIYTDADKVKELLEVARKTWHERDNRLADMIDETTETYYSCSLCQSFAPTHVCVVTPERPGLCGAYNWLDCRASYEINPHGPNQPIEKGDVVDERLGKWKGVDEFVVPASGNAFESFAAYSIMEDPMTSCGCFEAIGACLFAANAIMVVDRDYTGDTPCGMAFSTLAGSVGGGMQTPGFVGISKFYIGSKKFVSAEGGIKRLAWLPKALKEQMKDVIEKRGEEIGVPNLYDMIATEENATTEEEVIAFMTEVGHPALEMDPLM